LPNQISSFVGRRAEIAQVRQLLKAARVVTLTGVGGIGKTRLALELAEHLLPTYSDGVWLVDLTHVRESSRVPAALSAVLGLRDTGAPNIDQLIGFLRSKSMLVLLDNCEHMVQACAELTVSLLWACRDVQVLATSREPLGLLGEVIWRVPGMTLSVSSEAPNGDLLRKSDGMQLFVDRATAVSHGFRLNSDNWVAVDSICRQLDGIPLGIELAAARVNVLTPVQIAARLHGGYGLLESGGRMTSPRHQTLRAAVEWSYGLLNNAEQTLFNRLSVFAGGCCLEAAETICADDGEQNGRIGGTDIVALTIRLVNCSTVEAEAHGGTLRYRQVETLRQYAEHRLAETGETTVRRDRHLDWYLNLAEVASPELSGPDQRMWLLRLEREQDNLRMAMRFSLEDPPDSQRCLRLAWALHTFWLRHGHAQEGLTWLDRALDHHPPGIPADTLARVNALKAAGILAVAQRDYDTAEVRFAAGLRAARELNDLTAIAEGAFQLGRNRYRLGYAARAVALIEESLATWRRQRSQDADAVRRCQQALAELRGDFEHAADLLEERLGSARRVGDAWEIATMTANLGVFAYLRDEHSKATDLLECSRAIFEDLEEWVGVAWCITHMGRAARRRGELAAARDHFSDGLALFQRTGVAWGVADCIEGQAGLLILMKQFERAACLLASAEKIREANSAWRAPRSSQRLRDDVSALRGALGYGRFDSAWRDGREWTIDTAISVIGDHKSNSRYSSTERGLGAGPDTLTPREFEVATLISRGLSNHQVAEELIIAPSTAERHVANILAKLGLTSRTQVAAWILQRSAQPNANRS
jgi:non-specific serine/threonine protein kinase